MAFIVLLLPSNPSPHQHFAFFGLSSHRCQSGCIFFTRRETSWPYQLTTPSILTSPLTQFASHAFGNVFLWTSLPGLFAPGSDESGTFAAKCTAYECEHCTSQCTRCILGVPRLAEHRLAYSFCHQPVCEWKRKVDRQRRDWVDKVRQEQRRVRMHK